MTQSQTHRRRSGAAKPIAGTLKQFEAAEWEPLLGLAGDLTREFMWMGEMELVDGTSVHAYKHHRTRRCVHLAASGDAFEYVPPPTLSGAGAYRPIGRSQALQEAFTHWDELTAGDPDYEQQRAYLDTVLAHGSRGEPMAYDPAWLLRQRAFEEASRRAVEHEQQHDPDHRGVGRTADGDSFYGDLEDAG